MVDKLFKFRELILNEFGTIATFKDVVAASKNKKKDTTEAERYEDFKKHAQSALRIREGLLCHFVSIAANQEQV